MPPSRLKDLSLGFLLAGISAVLWMTFWFLNKALVSDALVTTGISLIYIPAGIRLLLIMVFGVWGAVGIVLADPILFVNEFGRGPPFEMMVNAAISGFGPLIAVKAAGRLFGISPDLDGLGPWHLPLLSLAVSLFVPLLFNIQFILNSRYPVGEFARNYTAMATGDFLGCFLVLAAARAIIWAVRAVTAQAE